MTLELYHRIADEDSAAARREIVALGLAESIRFRNLAYDEVATDFRAHGGTRVPALWNGEQLVEGRDAVIAALNTLAKTR